MPDVKPIDDEWWTTAMVCAHLKLGRRALWDIRRDPLKGFPEAIKPGGKMNLFRAVDVRSWMEQRSSASCPALARSTSSEAPKAQAPVVQISQEPTPAKHVEPRAKGRGRRKTSPVVDARQLELF